MDELAPRTRANGADAWRALAPCLVQAITTGLGASVLLGAVVIGLSSLG